jgi:maltose alpha-D-glucosyltransferase / alpha-amylase
MIEDLWYKNTTIYSLDLETFMDASGDGVGDFEGLMRRIEYLEYLGVGAVWLAPFQPSPRRDNGYDVSDYYGVDPRYGSSGEFVEFVHQATKRGIRVLMDLVVNHTSDRHRWFRDARSSPHARRRDWYIWAKKRPADWKEGMIFPGVQERTWTYDRTARSWYFHRFFEFQPDLNMDNPHVRAEVRRIMGYWLELGVAGFRVDAVPFLIESTRPGAKTARLNFDYLAEFRRFLQWRVGDAILLGEANVAPEESVKYFGEDGGSGIHMMFNFFVNQHLFLALATERADPLIAAIEATREIPLTAQWANFLRNHDELDLGRLSEEDRRRVFDRFAPEPDMQLYERGIRRRLGPMLADRRHEELAYSLMFSMPGTPVLRYGDELGMGDDLSLRERDAVRTPMQWDDAPHGGFSAAAKTIHPVIAEGVWGYPHINVAAQRRKPGSLLNWTARMIRLRKECPEIGWGRCTTLETGSPHVLALRYDWRDGAVIVVHNLAERPQEARIAPGVPGGHRLANLLVDEDILCDDGAAHHIVLDALGYAWFRVGGLDYGVNRQNE